MTVDIKRIAINAGGGDAPGLNAVIHAAVYAARALAEGQNGVMVALNPPRIDYVPLKRAVAKLKTVPPNSNGIVTPRALEISFGD